MFDNSWQALLRPGDATDFFQAPLPPFAPDFATFERGNALWLAELSRWIYRDQGRGAALQRTSLRETWFLDRRGTQCGLVTPIAGAPYTVLAFRGTNELRDWLVNLSALPQRWPRGGLVHRGFLRALLQVWRPLRQQLRQCAGPLFVTGHSLGGALATLAGAMLKPRAIYTFGAPRVGDGAFAASLHAPLYRIENRRDVVPRMPTRGPLLQFVHTGTLCRIGDDGRLTLGGDVDEPGERLDAGDRRWYDPASFLCDHAPINYSAALRRALQLT